MAALLAGCQPDLGTRPSEVESIRLLGVRAEPAEAAPGAEVSYSALLVDEGGERGDLPLDWAFCNKQKPLSSLDDVDPLCFVSSADYLAPLGTAPSVKGKLPLTACSLFGPDVPPAEPMMPPGRPADPDLTGGYYQPVRILHQLAENDYLLGAGESRLSCGLPGATPETALAFKSSYKPNENPVLAGVSVVGDTETALTPDDGTSTGFAVRAGSKITLRAAWPACPDAPTCGDGICSPGEDVTSCLDDCMKPHGCGGAEAYVYYDPATRMVTPRREAITVSWFATAGSFATDRSGRAEDEKETTSDDAWTAPAKRGQVAVWVVIRDDRGGVSWKRYRIDVE